MYTDEKRLRLDWIQEGGISRIHWAKLWKHTSALLKLMYAFEGERGC